MLSFRERTNVDGSLRKVLGPHGKLKEGSSAAPKVHVGFSEDSANARKVDRITRGCTKT